MNRVDFVRIVASAWLVIGIAMGIDGNALFIVPMTASAVISCQLLLRKK